MRVLSGKQPWVWWILHGGKDIENRVWNTHYRGLVLLHASLRDDYEAANLFVAEAFGIRTAALCPKIAELPRGGIVGYARIKRVIAPGYRRRDDPVYDGIETGSHRADGRWHMQDRYGFVLSEPTPLPFLPCPGALNLFRPREAMIAHARAHGETD